MKWAIRATAPTTYLKCVITNGVAVNTSFNAVLGTITNIINYDGISPYTPPANCSLVQVADTVQIGDIV